MSRSAIYVANTTPVSLSVGNTIPLGSIVRRFGCHLDSNGTSVICKGSGYYRVSGTITVAPASAGGVTVSLLNNGTVVPGAIANTTTTANAQPVTLPINALVRETCCDTSALTLRLSGSASVISNVSVVVDKE